MLKCLLAVLTVAQKANCHKNSIYLSMNTRKTQKTNAKKSKGGPQFELRQKNINTQCYSYYSNSDRFQARSDLYTPSVTNITIILLNNYLPLKEIKSFHFLLCMIDRTSTLLILYLCSLCFAYVCHKCTDWPSGIVDGFVDGRRCGQRNLQKSLRGLTESNVKL